MTISGERRQADRTGEEARFHVAERVHGAFKRSFQLPDRVDPDAITAACDRGVLTITVAKAEVAKARKINVRTEVGVS